MAGVRRFHERRAILLVASIVDGNVRDGSQDELDEIGVTIGARQRQDTVAVFVDIVEVFFDVFALKNLFHCMYIIIYTCTKKDTGIFID